MRWKKFLAIPLLFVFLTLACKSLAWVNTVESIAKIAVPIAGSIVTAVDPGLAPIVAGVQAGFTALIGALDTFKTSPTDTNLQKVQAAFNAVNTQSAELLAAAQIKNPASVAKAASIIQLFTQAVNEIGALLPPSTTLKAARKLPGSAKGLTAAELKKQFNAIVAGDPAFQAIP
jgi:hypothetical protein